MSLHIAHRIRVDLSARTDPGEVVLVRWHHVQGASVPTEVVRLSRSEFVDLVCAVSEGWAVLCPADQALRKLAVADIVGGCP